MYFDIMLCFFCPLMVLAGRRVAAGVARPLGVRGVDSGPTNLIPGEAMPIIWCPESLAVPFPSTIVI